MTEIISINRRTRLKAMLGFLVTLLFIGAHGSAASCEKPPKIIQGKLDLAEGCVFETSIKIISSNTILDCKGSTFLGLPGQKIGLLIDSEGRELNNVVVRNCIFRGFESSGIRISWDINDVAKGNDKEEIYRRTPTKILLDNIKVIDSGRVGVYIDDYVSGVSIVGSEISNSGGVGIYLEHSSRDNKIIGNVISKNGFRNKSSREGLAIDSSANNEVIGNSFVGNSAGGVFLYKNCGEHFDSGRQVIRWQHSNFNIINNNKFFEEKIGIWLASRQNKKLDKWGCGDPKNTHGNYDDFANNNIVADNNFCKVETPFIDSGFRNTVLNVVVSCI